ncbi:MAG: transcriptional regulator [Alphaproteobacteria bacterium]|nr:MAG: transcriptional regulator [Alphaproteobacteria bacterium]
MSDNPAQTDAENHVEVFRVLGHETRLRLLTLLAAGEHAVSEIDAASGIGQPGLSQQLAILRKARLVITRRAAKQVYYRVDPVALEQASKLLAHLASTAAPDSPRLEPTIPARGRTAGSAANFARMV